MKTKRNAQTTMNWIVLTLTFFGVVLVASQGILANETPQPPTITYTPSTETQCDENGKCWVALYSGAQFGQNSTGDWVNASDVLSITKYQDDITFHYDGIKGQYSITFEAGVIHNSNYYSMATIKNMYPQIIFDFPTQKNKGNRKYAVNISNIPVAVQPGLKNITLTYKSHDGFTLADLKQSDKKYQIKDAFELLFNDLTETGFTYEMSFADRRIYIGNFTDDKYIDNSLYLDPTVQLQDNETENTEDVTFCKAYGASVGITKFDISSISSGSTIDNASFNYYIFVDRLLDYDLNIYRIPDQTWTEDDGASSINTTWWTKTDLDSSQSFSNAGVDTWGTMNVTTQVQNGYAAGHSNLTLGFEDPDNPDVGTSDIIYNDYALDVGFFSPPTNDKDIIFYSRAYTDDISKRAYLNISYTESSNTAPTLTANATAPVSVYNTTDLLTNITMTDPEADTLTGYTQHYIDGVTSGGINSQVVVNATNTLISTLSSANFVKGDVLIVEFWAGDGTENTTKSNMTATVLNSVPTIGTPTLNDSTPYTNEGLLCSNGSYSDADDDSANWHYLWYDGNSKIAGQTANTLDLTVSGLDKGDVIKCSTIADDGTVNATAWINSTTATIQNTAPTTTTPTLYPTTAYKTTPLITCNNASVSDDDNDAITWLYQWYVNAGFSVTTQNITNATYSKGDELICEIKANDGTVNSTAYNFTSLTVLNTAPTTPDIDPTTNANISTDYQLITCENSTDADSDTIYYLIYGDTNADPTTLLQNATGTTYNWTGLSLGKNYFKCQSSDLSSYSANTTAYYVDVDVTTPTVNEYYQWDSTNTTVDFGLWTDGFVSVNWNLTDIAGINTSECVIKMRNKNYVSNYTNLSYIDDATHPDYDAVTGYKNLTCYTEDMGGGVTRVSANMTRSYDWRPLNTALDQDSAAHDNSYYSHGGRSTKITFNNITDTINTTFIFLADVGNQTNTVADLLFYSCNSSYVSGDFTTDSNCALVGAANPNATRDVNFNYLIGALETDENGTFGGVVHTETMYGISYCPGCTNTGNSWVTYSTNVYDGHSATSPNQGTAWTTLSGEEFNVVLHVIDNTRLEFNLTIPDNRGNQLSVLQTDDYGVLANLVPFGDIQTDNTTGGLVSYYDIQNVTETGTIWINTTISDPNADTVNCSIYLLNNDSSANQTLLADYSIDGYGICPYEWDTTTIADGDYRLNVTAYDGSLTGFDESAGYIRVDNTNPQIDFVNPTDPNNTNTTANYTYINWTITETNNDTVIINWNGTNTTITNNYINKTGLIEGVYTYYAWANDTAGNTNQTETRTITIDWTNPVLTISSPINTTTLDHTVLYNVSMSESCNLTVSIDGGANTTLCSYCTSYLGDGAYVYTGTHNITYYIIDMVGLTDEGSVTFSITDHVEGGGGEEPTPPAEPPSPEIPIDDDVLIIPTESDIIDRFDAWLDIEIYTNDNVCMIPGINYTTIEYGDNQTLTVPAEGECLKTFSITPRPIVYVITFIVVFMVLSMMWNWQSVSIRKKQLQNKMVQIKYGLRGR